MVSCVNNFFLDKRGMHYIPTNQVIQDSMVMRQVTQKFQHFTCCNKVAPVEAFCPAAANTVTGWTTAVKGDWADWRGGDANCCTASCCSDGSRDTPSKPIIPPAGWSTSRVVGNKVPCIPEACKVLWGDKGPYKIRKKNEIRGMQIIKAMAWYRINSK